ncbi:Queuine tRNA-ribosyltransferase [Gossypium arboreum]|uniref:Queuine tRNA-ribosyltransferase n=1 Tax=Gossypium arboreum TaxID=29729 RepID=A0A0B0M9S7_GOSAR|nr:Queuine tRNA-ribosyltransferase [Gossypium arboreum]
MVVQKQGRRFPQTWAAIKRHDHATWPWLNLPNKHGRATCPCLAPMDNIARMTRACANLHDRGRSEPRQTRPCDTIL